MISFNPSTTYGDGALRSRKPQFEDLCALQLLAQPYAGNAHVEARLFVRTLCWRVARVSAGGNRRNAHACFTHSLNCELVHLSADTLSRPIGMNGI
jgi:hypothetical protein